jgi:protease I
MNATQARVAVLLHDDYQELEFWYPVLRFREEGAAVTVVAPDSDHTYVSRLGYPVIPDLSITQVSPRDFDGVVVPGAGAADKLATDARMTRFVAEAGSRGAVIGAISRATSVLEAAGLLPGLRVAASPDARQRLTDAGAQCADEQVVSDKRIITARTPDDLPAFFGALVRALASVGK